MMATGYKDCFCHTCKKSFHHLGIARHRAYHRDKKEDCEISYSTGDTYTHNFSDKALESEDEVIL